MKYFIVLFVLVLVFPSYLKAEKLTPDQHKLLVGQSSLRQQMNTMLQNIGALSILMDIESNRENIKNFQPYVSDAETILSSISKIRKLDTQKVFEPFLKKLEEPTLELLKYAKLNDEKAMIYPKQIFKACFSCHEVHRDH